MWRLSKYLRSNKEIFSSLVRVYSACILYVHMSKPLLYKCGSWDSTKVVQGYWIRARYVWSRKSLVRSYCSFKVFVLVVKGLILHWIFTLYLYYAICIGKCVWVRLSKLLRITKWMSKLPHVWVTWLLRTVNLPCDLGTYLFSPLP